jgi:hypothetical protein
MPDDLNTSNAPEQEEEAVFEFTSPSEDIASAFYALSSVSELDVEMLPAIQKIMVKRIKRRSIKIIDYHIKYIYDCIFEEKKEDEEEDS